jgi:hypothetical protein
MRNDHFESAHFVGTTAGNFDMNTGNPQCTANGSLRKPRWRHDDGDRYPADPVMKCSVARQNAGPSVYSHTFITPAGAEQGARVFGDGFE